MFRPLKSPKTIDTIIITLEMVKIDDKSAMRRKCDQPGVVGENDNCEMTKEKKRFAINKSYRRAAGVKIDTSLKAKTSCNTRKQSRVFVIGPKTWMKNKKWPGHALDFFL
jgi:hypothetical protein